MSRRYGYLREAMASHFTSRPEDNPCAELPLPSSLTTLREYWFEFRRLMKQSLRFVKVFFDSRSLSLLLIGLL